MQHGTVGNFLVGADGFSAGIKKANYFCPAV
jgi:hypothetical protein